jgi:signal peptidase I
MEHFFTTSIPDSDPEGPPENPLASIGRFIWELTQTILLAVILFLIINSLTTRIRVQSVSMQPTLFEPDLVLVNRLAYKLGQPQREDVIIFNPPVKSDEPYIKRVIGLPGDIVRVANGVVYVNDNPLKETYIAAPPNYNGSWTVPDGHIFVLGDNRNNSSDSHQWGMVPLASIIGKAEFIYWPVAHWKMLTPAGAAQAASPPEPTPDPALEP